MRNLINKLFAPKLVCAVSLLGLAMGIPSWALTAPALTLTDGTNTVTIDSTGPLGTVTFSPGCASCSTTSYSVVAGSITWSGNIGNFAVSTVNGRTKPALGTAGTGNIDLGLGFLSTGAAGGTLTISWSDTGFDGIGPVTLNETSSIFSGTGGVLYTGYVDNSNNLLAKTTQVVTFGPTTGNGTVTGTAPSAQPFSMTLAEAITLAPNSSFFNDAQLISTPVPALTLACAQASGQTNSLYLSSLVANGGVPPYTFGIASGSLPTGLSLNPVTGVIQGTPTATGTFSFASTVMDALGSTASTAATGGCMINITSPAPLTLTCSSATAQVNSPYASSLIAMGGVTPYKMFSITPANGLPAGLFLNGMTGAITGTPTTAGAFNFTATVVDSNGTLASNSVSNPNCGITVTPPPPITSNCIAINATQGNPIAPVTLSATGGVGAPYTFTVTGLPAGLVLSSAGVISGTPLANGTFPYTVTITDKNGNKGTLNCSVTVAPPPITSNCIAINATQGSPISPVTLSATGGVGAPYTFTATGLPAGLVLSSAGVISGTPTTHGTFPYTVTITDKNGNKGTLNCSVTVAPPTITPIAAKCATATAQVGVVYSSSIAVTGGSGSYTFSLSTGSLPAGLKLNTTTGAITGTPTAAGIFGFTVKVVDNNTGSIAYSSCTSSCGGVGSTVTVDTSSVLGNLGNSHTYSVNGVALTAYGFNNNGTPTALYAKNQGTTEKGLGIASDSDFEINTTNFIQLDVSQLVAAGFTNAQITFNSVQSGEGYNIYGSNTLGSLGTKLSGPGTLVNTFSAMPGYGTWKYIGVQASAANVELGALAFTAPAAQCNITVASAPAAGNVTTGDTATIGFWHNQNGQYIISILNGGPSSKTLANTLAYQLPYLYGPNSPNNLTNKTNTDVAALFMTFFNVRGAKTNAQILGAALASYVTSTSLSGTDAAITSARSTFGFNSSVGGTAMKSYNVGSNGSAIGLVNNQSYTVLQLLDQANLDMQHGTFDANAFNTIFDGINVTGDIIG